MKRSKKAEGIEAQIERILKHTMFCGWVSKYGYYDKELGCTCGRDELAAEILAMRRVLDGRR